MTLTDALAVLCRNHLRGWEDESQGWAIMSGAIPHGIDMATDATGRSPYVLAWETVRQHVIDSRRTEHG